MALISCPECEHQISEKAVACPSCGFPLREETNRLIAEQYLLKEKAQYIIKCPECGTITNRHRETCSLCHAPLYTRLSLSVESHRVEKDVYTKHILTVSYPKVSSFLFGYDLLFFYDAEENEVARLRVSSVSDIGDKSEICFAFENTSFDWNSITKIVFSEKVSVANDGIKQDDSKIPLADIEAKRANTPLTEQSQAHKFCCPRCGGTNIQTISLASKAASAWAFGILAANKLSSQYHCNSCGCNF